MLVFVFLYMADFGRTYGNWACAIFLVLVSSVAAELQCRDGQGLNFVSQRGETVNDLIRGECCECWASDSQSSGNKTETHLDVNS